MILLDVNPLLKVFNPNQPRDQQGQWTVGGGGGNSGSGGGGASKEQIRAARTQAQLYRENPSESVARGALTRVARQATTGGAFEQFHPGEVTVYRAGGIGAKGTSFTLSRRIAEGYLELGKDKITVLRLTREDPAIAMNRLDPGSRYSNEREVFVDTSRIEHKRLEIAKSYNPNQPRVPAGSSQGGQFGSVGGYTVTVEAKPGWKFPPEPGARMVVVHDAATVEEAKTKAIHIFRRKGYGVRVVDVVENLKKAFDPAQPRDQEGRWTSGGASTAIGSGGTGAYGPPDNARPASEYSAEEVTFRDSDGYKLTIVTGPGAKLDNVDHAIGRRGQIRITNTKGKTVDTGYWMDWPEKGWGLSRAQYEALPQRKRMQMEAEQQVMAYRPLKEQFADRLKDLSSLKFGRRGKMDNPLLKAYDPNQPRVPAGSPAGGQFGSVGAGAVLVPFGGVISGKGHEIKEDKVGPTSQRVFFAYSDGKMLRDKIGVGRRFMSAGSAVHALGSELKQLTKVTLRTLYVKRRLLNAGDIHRWAASQGIQSALAPDEMHVTVAFSREPVDWSSINPDPYGLSVISGERAVHQFPPRNAPNGALVLTFSSDELPRRWQYFRDAGASWDFPEYQPHVTITYSVAEADVSRIEPYRLPLVFGPEEFAEVNEDWANEIIEVPTS